MPVFHLSYGDNTLGLWIRQKIWWRALYAVIMQASLVESRIRSRNLYSANLACFLLFWKYCQALPSCAFIIEHRCHSFYRADGGKMLTCLY